MFTSSIVDSSQCHQHMVTGHSMTASGLVTSHCWSHGVCESELCTLLFNVAHFQHHFQNLRLCTGMQSLTTQSRSHASGLSLYETYNSVQSGVVSKFPFDPLGLDSPTNAEKEIKNGRLAMVRLCCRAACCRIACCAVLWLCYAVAVLRCAVAILCCAFVLFNWNGLCT